MSDVAQMSRSSSRPSRVRPAWDRLWTMALAHFTNDLYAAFLAPLLPLVVAKFGLSLALAGLMGTAFNATAALTQPLFGLAADRVRRPAFAVLGPTVTVLGMGLVGLAPTYGLMLLILFLTGLGVASFHPQAFALAGEIGGAQRGTALSVFVAGGELGYALGPLFVAPIVGALGLHGTVAAAVPGLAACAVLWSRTRTWQGTLPPAPDRLASDLRRHGPLLALVWLIVVIRSVIILSFLLFLPLLLRQPNELLLQLAVPVRVERDRHLAPQLRRQVEHVLLPPRQDRPLGPRFQLIQVRSPAEIPAVAVPLPVAVPPAALDVAHAERVVDRPQQVDQLNRPVHHRRAGQRVAVLNPLRDRQRRLRARRRRVLDVIRPVEDHPRPQVGHNLRPLPRQEVVGNGRPPRRDDRVRSVDNPHLRIRVHHPDLAAPVQPQRSKEEDQQVPFGPPLAQRDDRLARLPEAHVVRKDCPRDEARNRTPSRWCGNSFGNFTTISSASTSRMAEMPTSDASALTSAPAASSAR